MLNITRDSRIIDCSFESDGYLLYGTLHLPHVESPPVVIGSHGLLSSGESPKQIDLARRCAANGIAFLRFDHRSCGRSQGPAGGIASLEGRSRDIVHAARWLASRPDTGNKVGLFGSSMGGAACITAFAGIDAAVLVTFAAPIRSRTLGRLQENTPNLLLSSRSVSDQLHFDLRARLNGLHHVLIFHGENDDVVPPGDAEEIYERSQPPKRIIRQKGGDHRMSHPPHQRAFIRDAVDWYKTCFGL